MSEPTNRQIEQVQKSIMSIRRKLTHLELTLDDTKYIQEKLREIANEASYAAGYVHEIGD